MARTYRTARKLTGGAARAYREMMARQRHPSPTLTPPPPPSSDSSDSDAAYSAPDPVFETSTSRVRSRVRARSPSPPPPRAVRARLQATDSAAGSSVDPRNAVTGSAYDALRRGPDIPITILPRLRALLRVTAQEMDAISASTSTQDCRGRLVFQMIVEELQNIVDELSPPAP